MPLVIVMSLLAACATASSNPASVCPPIKIYSREFQKKLADEIEKAPENAAFVMALRDYALVRGQLWACKRTIY